MEFQIEPEVVYVLDKNENHIAEFKKDDRDTIINPRIKKTQNAESTLTFSISINNPKWEQIKNPENLYIVEDMVFSTNFDGSFNETISDNGEELVTVTAYERQQLLSRKYVRVWNSTTGFDIVDTFMVVILSNGNLPLRNNGKEVVSAFEPGTSGYALDGLLYGTGWTTGTCDVEGKFDLETDMTDIYENIMKVQELWGGILIFDSLNKKVHHRDETKYLPYSGYEVKYAKNMQSSEKMYNNKIITKLCPLGEGNLNIKTVNDGSEWLTNFTYTDTVLEAIVNNPDITEPMQLKEWGERKLQDLCKPSKELTVETVLLNKVPGYELETVDINHIVDVINYAGTENDIEQLRVVNYEYGIWDYSDAVIDLSDITLESTSIFKKAVKATNEISNGTLDSSKVVIYYNGGESLEQTTKRFDQELIQTKSDLTKADDEIKASVTQTNDKVDNLTNTVVDHTESIAEIKVGIGEVSSSVKELESNTTESINEIKQTSKDLSIAISNIGGDNLIRNSAMINGFDYWLSHLKVPYIESDYPPENPEENDFWYCTLTSGNYMANQMYRYSAGGEWKETPLLRKTIMDSNNLFIHTTSNEEFTDGTRAATRTMSGRVIKIDGKYDYTVSHVFNITQPITINKSEEYMTISCMLKNNIVTGNIGIGVMFFDEDNFTYSEKSYSVYEPVIFLTPDDCKELTKIQLKIKIPKKEDFIMVTVSPTAPTDTTKTWLDTSIFLPKTYNEETSQWEILNTHMTLYNEDTRELWTYREFFGFYYQTPSIYDTMEIKTCYAGLTFYPVFQVYTGDTEPTPYRGLCWNNQTTNLVKRAKYANNQFIEWETLAIPSNALPTGSTIGVPLFDYLVPLSGYYEVADVKLEYNTIASAWSKYPGEVYGKNYKMDEKGFSIESGQNQMFIDEDEIVARYKSIDIFQINKDMARFNKIYSNESLQIKSFIFKEQVINNLEYLLFY